MTGPPRSRSLGTGGGPLEPDHEQRLALGQAAVGFVDRFIDGRTDAPAVPGPLEEATLQRLLQPPPEQGQDMDELLAMVQSAVDSGFDTASGKHLSYIPSGGLYTSALANFIAAALNRYTGGAHAAPGTVAMEESVIRWICELFGYPPGSSGLLLSGGSLANFTATVVARSRLGDDFSAGTVYVGQHVHHSVTKAAHLAGIGPDRIRLVPVDDGLRVDVAALRTMVKADQAAGLRPMLVVATAGTTDTGTIDDLAGCAEVAEEAGAWYHIDAAYGGFFVLTERGRDRLAGLSLADSITLDAHKSLFVPFGIGGLIVRDGNALVEAHAGRGSYMQDVADSEGLPHYFALGPELTRPFRGLSLWLPLHLHGVSSFRFELNRMLDLAEWAAAEIEAIDDLELLGPPDLSVVAFHSANGDADTQNLLYRLNQSGDVHVSSTMVKETLVLRLAFLNQRTTKDMAERAVGLLRA